MANGRGGQSLERARQTLEEALEDADNPVAATRALRRVAARFQFRYDDQRKAFRWKAEKLLRPFFEPSFRPFIGSDGIALKAAKAAVWVALDSAWEANAGADGR